MTRRRDFKRLVRNRMRATGETYTVALSALEGADAALGTSIPILPARDIPETLAFFERLGFTGRHDKANDYAVVRRGSIELHFVATPDLDPWTSAGMAYVRGNDIDSLYDEFRTSGGLGVLPMPHPDPVREELRRKWDEGASIARLGEVADQPWGVREFPLLDPNNNLIRFGQPLP